MPDQPVDGPRDGRNLTEESLTDEDRRAMHPDQPTDHRAEAERYVAWAVEHRDDQESMCCALIGIGHALLALADALNDDGGHERLPPGSDPECCVRLADGWVPVRPDAELLPEPDDAATVERDYDLDERCDTIADTGRCLLPHGHTTSANLQDYGHRFPEVPPVSVSEG